MSTLGLPVAILKNLFKPRSIATARRRRRIAKGERAAKAMIDALEPRQMMSATHLGFSVQPTNTVAGYSISTITVNILDNSEQVVTNSSSLVTFSISSGPAGESLFIAIPAVNGVVTLDGLSFTTAGNYTLRASATGLTAATSSSFAISADVADHLVITSGPSNKTAGQTFSAITVAVKDQYDNTVTTDSSNVTLALTSGSGTLLGTTTVAASSGVATFSDLSIEEAGTYTLGASDGGLLTDSSGSFTISPDAASKLVIVQQPGNITAGQTISTVTVQVQDQYDNLVTNSTTSITVALASGSGTLLGTKTVSASNGIATFSTLGLHESGSFTLGVTGGSLADDTSSSFTVNAAAAHHLVFSQQPGDATAGALGTVAVSIVDQYGNVVTSNTSNVTIAIGEGSGTLGGTKTVTAVSGVATFGNLSITKADGYTLTVTDGSLTGATSNDFTISPDAATKLVLTQQPGSTIAGQTLSTLTVQVRDQYDNVVTTDSSTVTVAIASGTGTLLGTATMNAVSGIATFSDLSIHEAGSFTLEATDGGSLTDATTSSFTISPDSASQLDFTQQPGNITAGALGTVKVTVKDQYGNVITSDSSTVTLSIASGPGSLLGTVSVAAVNGVATFSGLSITTSGSYTLGASDGSLTQDTSSSFTVSHTTAHHLQFTAQPTSMVAGNLLTGITAAVKDQYGNTVTNSSANVTFRLTGSNGSTNFVVQASSGVASLAGVYLVKAGSYSVRATSSGITLANSDTITVTPDVASQLIITQDTASDVAGETLSTIIVEVQDQFGNVVTTDSSTVSVAIASGTGTLLGNASVSAVNGIATFSNLSIQQADDFTLTVSDGALTTATTASFTISPDAPTQLVFTTQPVNNTAGNTLSNIQVSIEDQYGNVVTTDTSNVTIAIASGTGTLLGTKTVAASGGIATFSTLSIQKSGEFTFSASASGLETGTSSSVTIEADDAHHLAIVEQPSNGQAGLLSTIVVQVQDQYNNVVTVDSSNVTIAIASGTGTLLGTTTVAAVDGVATFSDLAFHTPGARTLYVTDGSLDAATSSSFTITTAAPSQLVITQDTSSDTAGDTLSAITVQVQDQYGNVITTDSSTVTISIASGTGTLLGTATANASSGIATFSDLSIRKSGSFTLQVTDGELASDTTASFTISPDVADHLAITQQTTNATAGHTLSSIVVQVQDQYGNVVTSDTSLVEIAISSGTGTLLGTATMNAVSGIATFNGLSIEEAGSFTLAVTDGSLTGEVGDSFTITPDVAHHIAINQQPSNGQATNAISPVIAAIVDQYGNVITTDSSTMIELSINSGGSDYFGESILVADHGVVTFNDVHIPVVGTYTLLIAAADVTSAVTSSFSLTAGPAAKLKITAPISNTVAGQTFSTITVQVLDGFDNLVTTDASDITLRLDGGSEAGSLSGTTTVTAINGVATFSNVYGTVATLYQMIASAPDLFNDPDTGDISNIFSITPDVADHLVFTQGPANHAAGTLGTIKVAVADQYGNTVTSDTSTITLTVASGSGSLLGTVSAAAVSGVATFSAAQIHVADSYTLGASDGGLTGVVSGSFTVSAAAPSQVVITTDATNTVAGQTISSIVAKIQDQYGNIVTTDTSNVTIAMSGGNITLSGTKTVAAVSGVATFSTLSITTTGSYTLTVTDGELTSDTTASFDITHDSAAKLAITQGPTTTVAGQTISTINVAVQDQFGNVVTDDTSAVTIALHGSGATLSGTKTVNAVNGLVSFTTLSMTQAGSYSMEVSDAALTGATSGSFTITPAAANHLAITQDATNATAGGTLTSIVVAIKDQYENTVTTDTSSVTISIASGTGTLLGTTTVSAVNGVATFSTLSIQKSGAFTLAIADGSLTGATTSSFTITPAVATQLLFSTQPVTAVAGDLMSTIAVSVADQYGNTVTSNSSNISLSVNNGGVTITLIVAASSGVASYSGIALTKAGTFAFKATQSGLPNAFSSDFSITPDVAAALSITQQPANGSAGTLSSIIVAVHDQYGNVVTTDTSNVTLSLNSGSATLGGTTTVAAINGIATFSNAIVAKAGTYTLAASDGSLTGETSSSFTITPAAAHHLHITQQTSNTTAGSTLSSLVVAVEDQYGNVVTNNTSSVTIAVASGTGTLLGTKTVNAVSGVATFSTLSIQQAGAFTLSVTDGSLTADTSSSFTISAGSAAKLGFTTQPSNGTAGSTLSSIVVAVQDQYGNTVTTDTSAVTLALSDGSVTLSGTTTVNAVSGLATFSGLSLTKSGSYTFAATDTSLTSATSSSFTVAAAAATKLVILQQPLNGQVGTLSTTLVAIQDQYDNNVTSDTSDVTIALTSGSGSLLGTTTVAASNGIAAFTGLSIQTPGSYTLSVTDGSLTSDSTDSFTLSAGAAHHLRITQQPTNTTVGTLGTIVVVIEDQYNNLVTTATSNVTLAVASGGGSLAGNTTVAAVGGTATFSNVSLTSGGAHTLRATSGSLTNTTSSSFTLAAGDAFQLVFTSQPASTSAGALESVSITVQDLYGNVVTTDSSEFTVEILSGSGTLGGTTTVTAVNGVATFDDLLITKTGSYVLSISGASLEAVSSNEFSISASDASQLVIVDGPSDTSASSNISTLTIAIQDQYGNVVTTSTSEVSIEVASGEGTMSGTTTVSAVEGVATFSGLFIRKADAYTLTVTSEGLDSADTESFDITPAAPAKLNFTETPDTRTVRTLGTVKAELLDAYGNFVSNATTSVTLAIATGSGAISGGATTVNAVNGIATFSGLSISKNGAFTLRASGTGLTSDTSDSFVLGAKLVFQKQPATTVAGVTLAPSLKVIVADASGKAITTDDSEITLSIFSGTGTMSGTLSATVVNGIATFDDLSIAVAGAYKIQATNGDMSVTSSSFTIKPAATSQYEILQDVSDAVAGVKIGPAIRIKFMDEFGNLAVNDKAQVTMSILTGPDGGALTGTVKTAISGGIATFSNIVIKKSGDYALRATVGSLTIDTETLTISAAAAKKILFSQQPTNISSGGTVNPSVKVDIVDAFGNLVTTSSNVTLTLASGPSGATLNTTVAAVNGRATFSSLSFATVGKYKIKASFTGLSAVTSNQFLVTANLA